MRNVCFALQLWFWADWALLKFRLIARMLIKSLEDVQLFCSLLAKPISAVFGTVHDVIDFEVIARSTLRCDDQVLFCNREVTAERKRVIIERIFQDSPGAVGNLWETTASWQWKAKRSPTYLMILIRDFSSRYCLTIFALRYFSTVDMSLLLFDLFCYQNN